MTAGERTLEVDLSGATPRVDGVPVHAELATVPGSTLRHLLLDGRSVPLIAYPFDRRGRWAVTVAGERLLVDVVDQRTHAIREMSGGEPDAAERAITAPMPGLVVRVEVEVGQTVQAGHGVVIVEAMKMENELKAPADGVVARVEVSPGQAVEKGAVLIVLE